MSMDMDNSSYILNITVIDSKFTVSCNYEEPLVVIRVSYPMLLNE